VWLAALDLVFPPRCQGCGRVDTLWCAACAADLAHLPLAVHTVPVADLEQVLATGTHEGILQAAVQSLKYAHNPALAGPLGQRLAHTLPHFSRTFDMYIPVPLHAARLAERGYNQAQSLCAALTDLTGIPTGSEALQRHRDTGHQVGLNRQERLMNVVDAFTAHPPLIDGKRLLLVDDVCTTGATLRACAAALRDSGAAAVAALTVTVA
jgi:ComF family protein